MFTSLQHCPHYVCAFFHNGIPKWLPRWQPRLAITKCSEQFARVVCWWVCSVCAQECIAREGRRYVTTQGRYCKRPSGSLVFSEAVIGSDIYSFRLLVPLAVFHWVYHIIISAVDGWLSHSNVSPRVSEGTGRGLRILWQQSSSCISHCKYA